MSVGLSERVATFISERDPFGDHFSAHDLEQIEGRSRFVGITFDIPRIRTDFVYPPIPVRSMDWQAVYDDDEPNDDGQMASGHGATETQAICDLIENHPRSASCRS